VQVEQREDLADFRGFPAPGREYFRREPLALTRRLVHALVVYARRLHHDRPGGCGHGPLSVVSVADDQTAASLVALACQLGYVLVDLGLQGRGEHPPRALADDAVDQGTGLGGAVLVNYAQHGRAFPTRAATRACSMTSSRSLGKVRPLHHTRHPTRGRSTSPEHGSCY
jgi:hypothetical protein